MQFLKSLFSGVYLYIAIASIAAFLSAFSTYYIKSKIDDAAYSKLLTAQANQKATDLTVSLATLQGYIKRMNTAAVDYHSSVDNLSKEISSIRKSIPNAKPLPVDCKPDDSRVRALSAAISAANKTASTAN